MTQHILYSFRRCPYAIRARLAILTSGINVEIREVTLNDKPPALLRISSKATVPVLITADEKIIDESINIMNWALKQSDPEKWLPSDTKEERLTSELTNNNDQTFKHFLDRYKYSDRYPENSELYYRHQAELILINLEQNLTHNTYLVSNRLTMVDIALLPFVRQFAFVNKAWFDVAPYPKIQAWLEQFLTSELFNSSMVKLAPWQQGDEVIYFPEASKVI
jgi:glutathione S-transferase